jgi:hypothetical protein
MLDIDISIDVLNRTEPPFDAATPEVLVQPIDYTRLRLLAECAAGAIRRPVDYVFVQEASQRTGQLEQVLVQVAPDADPGPAAVVVPTEDAGRYPANRVELQLAPGGPLAGAPAGQADAVFWSDAAVQKFLLPYLASCAGSRAGEVLNKVQDAWNRYPQSKVEVYALLHVNTFTSGTPLHLEDTLLVAFTRTGRENLELWPLHIFAKTFRPETTGPQPAPEPEAATVPYHRGESSRAQQRPGYVQLRALAEYACSLRDKAHYFVFRAGEDGFRAHHELPDVGPGDIVVPAFTPAVPAGRPALGLGPQPGAVWFTPEGGASVNLAGEGDALFWSTAAIEQFVFPYYASKGGLHALPDLADLVWAWTGHQPARGYYEGAWTEDAAGVMEEELLMEERVMGIIHLPTSEWTEVTEEGETRAETGVNLLRQLGVMTVDGAGGTHKHRLDEFIGRRRGK